MVFPRPAGFSLSCIAAAITTSLPAVSQTTSDANEQLEVIEVTAQKKVTSVQKTPIALSAFTGELFQQRGIDDLSNLHTYIPALHVGQEQDGFKISLRGIGLQGTSSISDSGVAFYIDDQYIARPAGGSAVFYVSAQ